MKNTGHNKAPKQADTLETSKKVLNNALMNALHKGGFLFGDNGNGAITPVIVNATVQQIVVAILAFLFSRTKTAEDTVGLFDYIAHTADHMCRLRLKDIPKPGSSSEGS